MTQLASNNHYVPQFYLRNWSLDGKKIATYRCLVPHRSIPLWRQRSIRAVARLRNLYVSRTIHDISDRLERWLDSDFENIAAPVFEKVSNNEPLSQYDWTVLVRSLAAQAVRTPSAYQRYMTLAAKRSKTTLDEGIMDVARRLESGEHLAKHPVEHESIKELDVPLRVKIRTGTDGQSSLVAQLLVGRASWHASMRVLLTRTVRLLERQNWVMLPPPKGQSWVTSDNPVVQLNYYSEDNYDFLGGWGQKCSDVFMPITPSHLLYTQIGSGGLKAAAFDNDVRKRMQRLLCESAGMDIYTLEPSPLVPALRPRVVDEVKHRTWKRMRDEWDLQQSEAEKDFWTENSDRA